MEAIVAVGLASNVLQFVDFTVNWIRISNELRHDAASSENRDHQVIATHLEAIAQKNQQLCSSHFPSHRNSFGRRESPSTSSRQML
ncbi:hypothetical protein M426DRAFT_140601 [Hypoxylon sp. CI-4A]|nr:hypothetical protein M426DRAFT_140601 [Hypoxylon sp. CI-4A]